MGMEEEAGICLAGAGRRGLGQVRRKSKAAGSRRGTERADRREGRQAAASNHFGTLGRRGCPGVPRAWGAPCWSQTLPGQDGVAKG